MNPTTEVKPTHWNVPVTVPVELLLQIELLGENCKLSRNKVMVGAMRLGLPLFLEQFLSNTATPPPPTTKENCESNRATGTPA